MDLSEEYNNTELSPEEESAFRKWAIEKKKLGDSYDYDIRGAWKELNAGKMKFADNGHLGDKYKKPNHPTFSDQSIYHSDETPGGSWRELPDGNVEFHASSHNMKNLPDEELARYFNKFEPDVKLVTPNNAKIDAMMSVYEEPVYGEDY